MATIDEQAVQETPAPVVSKRRKEYEVDKLFRAVVKLEGSDLHLKVDKPPFVRVKGTLRPINALAVGRMPPMNNPSAKRSATNSQ